MSDPPRLFVSHSSLDMDLTRQVCDRLATGPEKPDVLSLLLSVGRFFPYKYLILSSLEARRVEPVRVCCAPCRAAAMCVKHTFPASPIAFEAMLHI
jgi:hypothetical protein